MAFTETQHLQAFLTFVNIKTGKKLRVGLQTEKVCLATNPFDQKN